MTSEINSSIICKEVFDEGYTPSSEGKFHFILNSGAHLNSFIYHLFDIENG